MPKLRFTQKDKEEIKKLYESGLLTAKEIAIKYNVLEQSISKVLRKMGVSRKLDRATNEQIELIIAQYKEGLSTITIAENFGFVDSTIGRILKRNNVEIRPAELNKRKYNIAMDFFKKIDSEEKAYFLGLLYADGNLSSDTGWAIRLMLHPQDRDILSKFSKIIYGFEQIKETKVKKEEVNPISLEVEEVEKTYLYTAIYSKTMWHDLCKLGCTPTKTFDIRFPNNTIVPDDLIRHFVRGYFDGDGCISFSEDTRPIVDFTSNLEFIKGIVGYLEKSNINCNRIAINEENELIGSVQLTANENIANFYNLLYTNSHVYFNRKFNKFSNFNNHRLNKKIAKEAPFVDANNYGSFIPSWNDVKLTKENIEKMTPNELKEVADFSFHYFRNNGFPYTKESNNDLIKNFNHLKQLDVNTILNDKNIRIDNQSALNVVKHFAPHFHEIKNGTNLGRPSMLEVFNSDQLLMKVINNRLENGFHINGNMLKQGLVNSKVAFKGSYFNPAAAKCIYTLFAKENDIIYDYSMGFGQRLLANLSLPFKTTYLGVDVWDKSVNSNKQLYEFFKENSPSLDKNVEINQIGSEDYCPEQYRGKVNLAFSSPPYFNLEEYCKEESQAAFANDYPTFLNWWRKTVSNINKLLSLDGKFLLNIKEIVDGFNLAEDMCAIIKQHGFQLIDTYYLKLNKNNKFNNKTGEDKLEPIFVFERIK